MNRASGIVTSTNNSAVARNGVKLNVAELSICACRNASTTPMIETSAVSFWRPMKSFKQRRDDASDRLRQDDEPQAIAQRDSPSERAAALWLSCTDSMPAR